MAVPSHVTIEVPTHQLKGIPNLKRESRGKVEGYTIDGRGKVQAVHTPSLSLRFSKSELELMERARGLLGINRTELIRQSALSVAKAVIDGAGVHQDPRGPVSRGRLTTVAAAGRVG